MFRDMSKTPRANCARCYTTGIDAVFAWDDDAIAQSSVPSIDQVALPGQLLRALPWRDLSPRPSES